LAWKIQVHYNTVKKYFKKMGVHLKVKKSAAKTRQQSVIKARMKLLTQFFFTVNLSTNCMIDDESYFTVDGNEWHQQSYYESEDYPSIEYVKFILKNKFSAKVLVFVAGCQ
jgi:hypothetical protein